MELSASSNTLNLKSVPNYIQRTDRSTTDIIESPEPINASTLESPNSNDLQINKRSCCTSVHQWFERIYRGFMHSGDVNDGQLPTATDHQPAVIKDNESSDNNNRETFNREKKVSKEKPFFPFQRPYRTVKVRDKSSVSIACSSTHILMKQKPHLCLFDRQLTVVKKIPWNYNHVEICWSATLSQFILITERAIFTLDGDSMSFNQCQIDLINGKIWSSGSCSDTSLYLSTRDMSTCLYEYKFQPTLEFVKEWQLCALNTRYEGILTFCCSQGKIALIISNIFAFQRRIELRSSKTLERLWSVTLDAVAHCCSINGDQWMIMELLKPRLLLISSDGKIVEEHKIKTPTLNIIWNAIQLDKDTIVTLTMNNLNLHKLT